MLAVHLNSCILTGCMVYWSRFGIRVAETRRRSVLHLAQASSQYRAARPKCSERTTIPCRVLMLKSSTDSRIMNAQSSVKKPVCSARMGAKMGEKQFY